METHDIAVSINPPLPSAAKCSQYSYQPFLSNRHIRLFIIKGGPRSSPIDGTLERFHLDNPDTSYEALSYAWGDPTPVHEIICDDSLLPVASNLHAALLHLRYEDKRRGVWIDALCIDQSNLEERSSQVAIMAEIYSLADQVVVWLGNSDEHTQGGISALQDLEKRYIVLCSNFGDFTGFDESALWDESSEMFLPLRSILYRPYFHRAWVIQECAVARGVVVLCGQHHIPWSTLLRACMYLSAATKLEVNQRMATTVLVSIQNILLDGRDSRLLKMLSIMQRDIQATDPRDKVYSLIGVTAEGRKSKYLQPDYTLSIKDVYANAARAMIESSRLEVFSSAGYHSSQTAWSLRNLPDLSLPTWVPDWRFIGNNSTLLVGVFKFYKATGDSPVVFPDKTTGDPFLLSISGGHLSTVCKTWRVTSEVNRLLTYLGSGLCQRKADLSLTIPCPEYTESPNTEIPHYPFMNASSTTETIAAAYGATLIADQWCYAGRMSELGRRFFYRELDNICGKRPESDFTDDADLGRDRLSAALVSYVHAMLRIMKGRKVFRTHDGMLGLCPEAAEEGDCMVIFPGADVPMILRKADSANDEQEVENDEDWLLIGESYVHGMMDGQALKLMEERGTEFQTYYIR